MSDHKIILASVAPGTEIAVTNALAELLGLPEEGVKPLVSSVPIILVGGLGPEQAQEVAAAMSAAKQAGGNLVISGAAGQNMRSVNWPVPPKVGGRDIASFRGGAVAARPPSGQQHPSGAPSSGAPPASGAVSLVCPHCNGEISLQVAAAAAGHVSGVAQAPGGVDMVDTVGKALPEVPDVQGSVESPPAGSNVRTGPMDLEVFERGLGGGGPLPQSGDTLLQQLDKALDQPEPKPTPQPRAKTRKSPSPASGQSGRSRPRSPGGTSERSRGRDRRRRR